ncbi:MAG TPA: AMP-binding protein [Myxococcota bacterium]|jgi:fatty-acyl-CoA synthase|nr:AMP-binding protein [Myxococcota bacterium]
MFNLADCLDVVADACGPEDALVQGGRRLSWADTARRARNVATWMVDRGASRQGKVAVYTYNHPAYMESCWAAMKAACVPVNVNYRYREEELRYLLDNADAEFVVVHQDFAPTLAKVRHDLPLLRGVLVVGDGGAASEAGLAELPGAECFEQVAETDRREPRVERSADDLLFLYTGGTTGMPKGVMWRQADLYLRFAGGGLTAPPSSMAALHAFAKSQPVRRKALIGPPLMHGTGWFTAMITWLAGGTVVVLDDPKRFDPADLWGVVEREKVSSITIVGDSFAKPMLRELEARQRPYDLSSLLLVTSSGVMWSEETKQGLLRHAPQLTLIDSFSSSEAIGMGLSVTTAKGSVHTAKFQLSDKTRLFDEALRPVESKPGAKGMVGAGGPQPLGYYKDPAKSARTFVELEGQRFSVPGDWAVVNDDGVTLTLLGRGSVCINTGGEKVFPEEVEEVVKRFPGVRDCVVVGVPDEKFGEAITAVISTLGGPIDGEAVKAHVKQHLAGYKAPKHVVVVDDVYRSPSGKADFKRTKEMALEALGLA